MDTFPTPSEAPFFYSLVAVVVVYVIVGIAMRAAYRNAGLVGKLLYVVFFPAHWALFTFCSLLFRDHRFITVPISAAIGLVITLSSEEKLLPALIFGGVFFAVCSSSGDWKEKS